MEFPEEVVAEANRLLEKGKAAKAVACARDGSKAFPGGADIWEVRGQAEEAAGDLQAAKVSLSEALRLDPNLAIAALKLGNVLARGGEDARAAEMFQLAARLRPDSPVPLNNLGLAYMRMGDRASAIAAFEEGLRAETDAASRNMLYNNLGIVLKEQGDTEEALEMFRLALEKPTVEAYINLAAALLDLGAAVDAEEAIRAGMALGTFHPAAARTLATALALQDRIGEAAQVLSGSASLFEARQAANEVAQQLAARGSVMEGVELMTSFGVETSEDFFSIGSMLADLHQHLLALRAYQTALRIDRFHERALSGAALLLYKTTRFADAAKHFERQTKVSTSTANLADAYNGMGAAVEMTHSRLDLSVKCFSKAVELRPDHDAAFFSLVHLLGRICDWRDYEGQFVRVRERIDQGQTGGLGPIFALAYPLTAEQMCAVAGARAHGVMATVNAARPLLFPWEPDFGARPDKISVAVLSADFNSRPVGQLVQSVFKLIDKTRFEIFCFMSEGHDNSQVLVNIANSCDEWFWVKGVAHLEVAQMVNNERPNILLELNGYTDGSRIEVGALRPAPVTVQYLGFPYTLNVPGIDYVLTDRIVTPPEHHAHCFLEKVAFMPSTYMVNDHRQSQLHQIQGDFSVQNARNRSLPHHQEIPVLANFNHLQKLGPRTFDLWTQIMSHPALRDSKLWMLKFPGEAEPHLKREMHNKGVAEDRLLLTDKFASAEHLSVKRAASILLDTLEYNAHVSGLDALWVGLPLLTLAGSNMARRCGASFLRTSKIPELLARTEEEYVAIGQRLASAGMHKGSKLRELRERVEKQRLEGELFDTFRWVKHLERLLGVMWEVAAASEGQGPMNIALSGYQGWAAQAHS